MSLAGGGSARGLGVVLDKSQPKPQSLQAGGTGDAAGGRESKPQRLKREDHVHVKHDNCFSEWKVLVGPSDWKEHASGKIPDRFRIGNLPSNYEGSGLYELGVTPPAWLPPQRSHDCLKPQDVVVVYLGCSDNVHQHLLRYGQTGAHLEGIRSTRLFAVKNDRAEGWKADFHNEEGSTSFTRDHERVPSAAGSRPISNASMDAGDEAATPSTSNHSRTGTSFDQVGSHSPRGPRLFSEVFALGCSIAFRWAATDSKVAAERAEADLIEIFDYAWKRGGNFRQRSPDILAKIVMGGALGSNLSSDGCFGDRSTRTWFFFQRARVGVHIEARKPGAKEGNNRSSSSSSRSVGSSRVGGLFTLFRTSPQNGKSSEFTKLDIPLDRCGAPAENGTPCNALPVKGGKRCHLHKDYQKRSQGKSGRVAHTSQLSPGYDRSHHAHNNNKPATVPVEESPKATLSSSCFPYLTTPALPAPNRASPEPKRRGSLSFTSWLRTSEIRMARRSREWDPQQAVAAAGGSGSEGPKRSISSYSSILATTLEELQAESSSFRTPPMSPSRRQICGLRLDDGTVCPHPPRPERKRCDAHKGLRNQSPKSPRISSSSSRNTSIGSNGLSSTQAGFFTAQAPFVVARPLVR